ncbi:MAG: cupredoxin domain-containing protein [Actinobacteria bacterium]|nr:cupredoxin domain-containing protein [Actinomycetota bacterium]
MAVAVALAVTTAGLVVDARATGDGADPPLGPGLVAVDVGIHHSRFSVERVRVRRGTVVRFVVTNDDPIAHELVVGGDDVHDRHVSGSEAVHPPVPGEVSLAAGDTGVTTLAFDQPGSYRFACHLPGHLAYGMHGEVAVS